MSTDVRSHIRVLNVNDNASSRYVTTRMLRRAGFQVVEAEAGGSAVRLARSERPHFLVLDVRLPDMSGIDVCRKLKSDPETSSILVVQTSASLVTSDNRAEGLRAGADAYLAQPFEAAELIATLDSLLRGRRLESEARLKADALTQADQRKDEFLAMLAHELRNPLSAILTASRLLQTRGHEVVPRLADTIERQARHLARLVDDLLDISRITHGKIHLKREPVDLNQAVGRAIETCRPTLERKSQTLQVEPAPAAVAVAADPVRLEQVLSNVLGNASKYTPERGRIQVRVSTSEREGRPVALIDVVDDGIGLSPADLPRVFDLFFQVDTTLARSQSGLGIGLTMARRLVELHDGTIDAHSDGVGKGTRMTITLPVSDSPEGAGGSASGGGPRNGLRNTAVLLVDDNVDSCELMQMFLEAEGCHVTLAHDGEAAVRMVGEARFDVAIIDIGLPEMDGYQTASAIVETMGAQRPRLIALTGYGREEDRARSRAAGFDVHLVKPIDPPALTAAMDELLRTARVRLG